MKSFKELIYWFVGTLVAVVLMNTGYSYLLKYLNGGV